MVLPMQTCSYCGTMNRDAARFCQACGRSLEPACPRCGTRSRAGARYCAQCGTGLKDPLLYNRYWMRQALAQSSMSAVYQAEDIQLFNRRCVVKEMRAQHLSPMDRAEAERNFQREAAVLSSLSHPAIPQVYGYFLESGRCCLVMEYVEGESLATLMARSGPLPEAEVLRYAAQVADVLVYLSSRTPPVVHRDVKPSNIILRGDPPRAILVDFGVAKPKAGRGPDTSAWGTLGYAAPEQAAGHAEPRSDVYGLGATIYHLAAGDDPGDHPFAFPCLDRLSLGLQAILSHALQQSPDQRLDAREMKTALATLVAPEPVSALRLLGALVCVGFDSKTQQSKGPPVQRFHSYDSALHICLHLANQDLAKRHEHRVFVQFYSPDGQLYRVRQRPEPVIASPAQPDIHVGVFGLRIRDTQVTDRLGRWRAVVYLDEQKLAELHFEMVP